MRASPAWIRLACLIPISSGAAAKTSSKSSIVSHVPSHPTGCLRGQDTHSSNAATQGARTGVRTTARPPSSRRAMCKKAMKTRTSGSGKQARRARACSPVLDPAPKELWRPKSNKASATVALTRCLRQQVAAALCMSRLADLNLAGPLSVHSEPIIKGDVTEHS